MSSILFYIIRKTQKLDRIGTLKGDLWAFSTSTDEKSLTMPKNTQRGTLSLAGIVCYADKGCKFLYFSSLCRMVDYQTVQLLITGLSNFYTTRLSQTCQFFRKIRASNEIIFENPHQIPKMVFVNILTFLKEIGS